MWLVINRRGDVRSLLGCLLHSVQDEESQHGEVKEHIQGSRCSANLHPGRPEGLFRQRFHDVWGELQDNVQNAGEIVDHPGPHSGACDQPYRDDVEVMRPGFVAGEAEVKS